MLRHLPFAAALVLIPGCFLFDPEPPDDGGPGIEIPGSANLKAFASEQELQDYFLDQIVERNSQFAGARSDDGFEAPTDAASGEGGGNGPSPAPTQGGADSDGASDENSFSGTTIQEEGVDEADVVKTDGTYFYLIDDSVLRIVRATPASEMALLSEVELEGYGREIYLLPADTVVAITATYGHFYYFGGPEIAVDDVAVADDAVRAQEVDGDVDIAPSPDPYQYERPKTYVTIIDVSDREAPEVVSKTAFDGQQSASRMIDGVLHLVVSNRQSYFYDIFPALGMPELDVAGTSVDELVPHFRRTNRNGETGEGELLTWRNLYRPEDPDGFGIVSVVSMDIENDGAFSAVGVVAEPGMIYSSLDALYMTNTQYDFRGDQRETTSVYKFAYTDGGTVPVATGAVPGRILNQYSMSEYEGYLRVATTVGPTFSFLDGNVTEPTNAVYVLGEVDGQLAVVGSVDDIAPRETIQSARFVGAKGFVVTFEQIDPLFTLDLSDPRNPQLMGEIEVPGFSTFIVPMDENHLLTVGRYLPAPPAWGPGGLQLTIFDVSNFNQPVVDANVIIGGDDVEAWSEALNDPKAFNYFAEAGLIALPISMYEYYDFPIFIDEPDRPMVDEDPAAPPPTEPAPPDDGTGQSTPSDGETNEGAAEGEDAFEPQGFDGLFVYRVSVENGFEEVGRISTRYNHEGEDYYYYYPSYVRGVFINDDVYAVTILGIRTTPVDDMASEPSELVLPRPEYDGGDIIVEPGVPVDGGGSSGSSGSAEAGGAAEEPLAVDAG